MDHQIMNSVSGRYEGRVYEGRSWRDHFHNSFELIYVFSGQMRVTVNDRAAPLAANEFLLISPGMAHRIDDSADCRFFIAIFAEDYVPEWMGEKRQAAFYRFSVTKTELGYLQEHLLVAGRPERYRLRSCLYAVCAAARAAGGEMTSERDLSFVYEVNRYLSAHITEDFRRRDIAEALNYEEHYFSSLFRKSFGIGFKKYVNLYRFSLAQQMLVVTDHSMAEIAFACGFSGVRSFNDIFRELSGQAPSEYRRAHRSTDGETVKREGEQDDGRGA